MPSNRLPFYGKASFALFTACVIFFSFLQACSSTDSRKSNINAVHGTLGSTCGPQMRQAVDATSRKQYELALQVLLVAKNESCLTQFELASADQLLGSTYLLLGDFESAHGHLALAVNRNVLEPGLQNRSLYKVAQVSYLLRRYQGAIDYLRQYQDAVAEMQPSEYVLMARSLYAVERHEEAFAIMINLYAKHRSGEIVMKQEWIDFLKGMDVKQEALAG